MGDVRARKAHQRTFPNRGTLFEISVIFTQEAQLPEGVSKMARLCHCCEFSFVCLFLSLCLLRGYDNAAWFTVEFEGSDFCVGFTTGPEGAPTHWFQLRLVMRPPLAANAGQTVNVHIRMLATPQQSYKINGKMTLAGTEFASSCTDVDLKVCSMCHFQEFRM